MRDRVEVTFQISVDDVLNHACCGPHQRTLHQLGKSLMASTLPVREMGHVVNKSVGERAPMPRILLVVHLNERRFDGYLFTKQDGNWELEKRS